MTTLTNTHLLTPTLPRQRMTRTVYLPPLFPEHFHSFLNTPHFFLITSRLN